MKTINESKEILPIDFLTQFISKGWDEVGNLKASIDGIKKEFSGTKEVENILQDLIDAYLIAIGQFELYLNKKDYVDIPKEVVKESLTEGFYDSEAEDIRRAVLDDIKKYPEQFPENEYYYQIGGEMASRDFPFLPNYFLLDDIGEGDKEYEDIKRGYLDNGGKLTEDLANAPEKIEKINDGEKVELHTELPDYDIEVEQKGKKVEVEVEPKEAEWPEPEIGDNDIAAAKAALANGEIHFGDERITPVVTEVPEPIQIDTPIVTTSKVVLDDNFANMDFPDAEDDEDTTAAIRAWLNK